MHWTLLYCAYFHLCRFRRPMLKFINALTRACQVWVAFTFNFPTDNQLQCKVRIMYEFGYGEYPGRVGILWPTSYGDWNNGFIFSWGSGVTYYPLNLRQCLVRMRALHQYVSHANIDLYCNICFQRINIIIKSKTVKHA